MLPEAALNWLTGTEPVRIATLACPRSIIHELVARGHGVAAVEAEWIRAKKLASFYPGSDQLITMVAEPQALPLIPCSAQIALVDSGFDTSTPESQAQISRALQAGGWVAGWQIIRDDSVPWVQRLMALLRSVDNAAMNEATLEPEALVDSKYFPRVETKNFRLWVPITKAKVREMVAQSPAVAGLDDDGKAELLAQAETVFDGVGRTSELQLPYQLHCWKAHVDHQELTIPITLSDGALRIAI